jgi:hypothetical protein
MTAVVDSIVPVDDVRLTEVVDPSTQRGECVKSELTVIRRAHHLRLAGQHLGHQRLIALSYRVTQK